MRYRIYRRVYKKYYVYRITDIVNKKYYYGSRGAENPLLDIDKKYFSSSRDKLFISDQKENPKNYKYKIIRIFNTREEAIRLEIKLHNKFNVGINESFYNKVKQSSSKFDTTGKIVVKDKDGNTFQVDKKDPRYLSRELVGISKGIKYNEERLSLMRNKVTVKDKEGNYLQVDKADPKYLSGELVPSNKGRKHSEEAKAKMRLKTNPGQNKNKVIVKDIFTGEKLSIDIVKYNTDKRYVGITSNTYWLNEKNEIFRNLDLKKIGINNPKSKKKWKLKQITLEEARNYIKGN